MRAKTQKRTLRPPKPQLIAIVGGSGSGKTWLANQLQKKCGTKATRLSLDDFYRDRSHLSAKQMEKVNFDHPQAIDWKSLEWTLGRLASGRAANTPQYDFSSHSRLPKGKFVKPKPLIIIDGLWLLRRRAVRRFFSCRVFIDCPRSVCLRRRIDRDMIERGRSANGVREQFLKQVVPMHERFVAPQSRWATVVLNKTEAGEVARLGAELKKLLTKF